MANVIFTDSIGTLRSVFGKLEDEVVKIQALEASTTTLQTNKAELQSVLEDLHRQIAAARAALESDRSMSRKVVADARIEASNLIALAQRQADETRTATKARA